MGFPVHIVPYFPFNPIARQPTITRLEDLEQSLLDVVPRHDLISLIDQDPGNTLIAPCEATGTMASNVGKKMVGITMYMLDR